LFVVIFTLLIYLICCFEKINFSLIFMQNSGSPVDAIDRTILYGIIHVRFRVDGELYHFDITGII